MARTRASRTGAGMNVAAIMKRNPISVRPGDRLDRAIELMDEYDIRHLLVMNDAALAGVISDRDVLEATGGPGPGRGATLTGPTSKVGDVMRTPVTSVEADAPLTDALELFIQHRIGCLAVLRDGALVGLVTEVHILRAYADACRRGAISPDDDPRIGAHMTGDPITIEGDASGHEAAALMEQHGLRHLPVVEGERVVGMVSDRDIRKLRGRGELELTLVRELMSPSPQTAEPEERLSSVVLILSAERISALPVVSARRLVGIATTVDVMIPCALALQRL